MPEAPFPFAPCGAKAYPVLASVSRSYPSLTGRLPTCYSPVRRSIHPHHSEEIREFHALDLHVLGTPPAFVLSQDQTLRKSGVSGHRISGCWTFSLMILRLFKSLASCKRLPFLQFALGFCSVFKERYIEISLWLARNILFIDVLNKERWALLHWINVELRDTHIIPSVLSNTSWDRYDLRKTPKSASHEVFNNNYFIITISLLFVNNFLHAAFWNDFLILPSSMLVCQSFFKAVLSKTTCIIIPHILFCARFFYMYFFPLPVFVNLWDMNCPLHDDIFDDYQSGDTGNAKKAGDYRCDGVNRYFQIKWCTNGI